MPYTTEGMDEKTMEDRADDSVCAECFSPLIVCWGGAFGYNSMLLRCSSEPRHQGIARLREEREYNIETRRKFMVEEHGEKKALALRRFDAVVTLTKQSATGILKIMWPEAMDASPAEFAKAVGLCVDYGLDPRLDELFLIPFKVKQPDGSYKKVYETVRGIRATRKVALRKHKYSYVDLTPRLMTEEEEKKVYKKGVDLDKVRYITKLKDVESGAEAPGYGEWPMYKMVSGKKSPHNPKGVENGNSMENMAAIHSERAALERLYPADMPSSKIPVVDESFIDADYEVGDLSENTEDEEELLEQAAEDQQPGGGEPPTIRPVGDGKAGEQVETLPGGEGKTAQTTFPSPKGGKQKIAPGAPPATIEGEGFHIELAWLEQTLKEIHWDEDTTRTWAIGNLKVDAKGKISDWLPHLNREQAERFTRELNERAAKMQPELFK